jgi:beta-phosphoglucomutase-like phosphatase (HAD superfamily)
MTTVTDRETKEMNDSSEAASRYGVLFELEGIAGSARLAAYDVLKKLLGEHGIELLPAHVSRFCLHSTPGANLDDLLEALGASNLSADALEGKVSEGIALQLSSAATALPEPVRAVLDLANRSGVQMAAVSSLPQASAASLMEGLGLNEWGVRLNCESPDGGLLFPRPDSWLKLAKLVNRDPPRCGVIATSQSAAKSALSAGMHCVAIPDQFTAFQDFGGVDVVVETGNGLAPEEILRALCPHFDD